MSSWWTVKNAVRKGNDRFVTADFHFCKTTEERDFALIDGKWIDMESGRDRTEDINLSLFRFCADRIREDERKLNLEKAKELRPVFYGE